MATKDIMFRVSANTKNAEKNMGNLEKQTNSLASGFKKFGALVGITMGAKFFVDAIIEQEKAEKQLEVALGKTNQALLDYASNLQKTTAFGDEQIIQGMSLLAAFIKEEDQIKKVTASVLDLATAKNMDLFSAFDLVAKTVGSSTNALSRYGIEVEGAVGSTQRLESTVQNITTLYGGQATSRMETFGGQLQNIENQVGDLAEEIMRGLLPALKAILSVVSPLITFLGTGFNAASRSLKNITQDQEKLNAVLKEMSTKGVGIQRIAYEMKVLSENAKGTSIEVKNLDGNFANFIRGAVSEFNSLKQTVKSIFGDISKEVTDWIDINVARTRIKTLREELAKPLTEQQKLQIEINKLEKELADKIAGNVAAKEKSLITTNKQIEEEIKALELAKSRTSVIREQWLYQQKIVELQKELRKQILPPGVVEARQPVAGMGTVRKPGEVSEAEVSALPTEAELRERFKTFDIIANASAETFKETFSGILDGLFGDNSILQKLLSKTFGGFLDQMASSLGSSIFSGLLSFLPGGGLLSGLFSAFSGGAGRAKATAGGGTLMIQNNIAGEEINTVMVDLVPTAMNRAVRLRRA